MKRGHLRRQEFDSLLVAGMRMVVLVACGGLGVGFARRLLVELGLNSWQYYYC
mgnify:CR=1 FL=1